METSQQPKPGWIIRPATLADSRQMAEIQVASYQTYYAGLLPDEYLAQFTVEEQTQDWEHWQIAHPADILRVAVMEGEGLATAATGKIGGYGLGRPAKGTLSGHDGEIAALHIRSEYQGIGVGRDLFQTLVVELSRHGSRKPFAWVLKGNPATGFYEHLGGKLVGDKRWRMDEYDVVVTEVAYGWVL